MRLALLPLLTLFFFSGPESLPRFEDVTAQSGIGGFRNTQGSPTKDYILETVGGGCAFLDYDNDGWQDILLVGGSTLPRFRNGGDPICALYQNRRGGTFRDVTKESGLTKKGWGMGVTTGDYDNDGWVDLYITGYGSNTLFRNRGDGTFEDLGARSGTSAPPNSWSTSAAFFDYDQDGLLDLYVCRYIDFDLDRPPRKDPSDSRCLFKGVLVMCGPRGLVGQSDILYRNNGDGTFSDVSAAAGIGGQKDSYYGLGVVTGDYNNDGYPDLYVGNDTSPNLLYTNQGDGTFAEEGFTKGVAVSEDGIEQGSMGVDLGDYDNNGWLDIIVTNFSHDTNELYRNNQGIFDDVTWPSGIGQPSWILLGWGTRFLDFDNDAWLDLFIANGHVYPEVDSFDMGTSYRERVLLFRNSGSGRFEDVTSEGGEALQRNYAVRGVALGDYDNDGDLDLLMNQMDETPVLLRNQGGNRRNWLQLKLTGRRSNRDAIGARVRVKAGAKTFIRELSGGGSYASASDLRIHFGLGSVSKIDSLEIRWPRKAGLPAEYHQTLQDVPINQLIHIKEPPPGT